MENETPPISSDQDDERTASAKPMAPIVSSSKKSPTKKVVVGALVAFAIIVGAGITYMALHPMKKSTSSLSQTKNIPTQQQTSVQQTPVYSSTVAFQASNSPTNSISTILGTDGTKIASFTSSATDSTYDGSAYSQQNLELQESSTLITTNKTWSSFSIVSHNGNSSPVASSLTTLLAGNAHPGSALSLSDSITFGDSSLLGLENSSNNSKLVKVDLAKGTVNDLLTLVSTAKNTGTGYVPVHLATVSRDGNTAYLFIDQANINSTPSPAISLVTVDLGTGKFTLKSLPNLDILGAAVSKDGKYIAYTDSSTNNGYASETTHILNIATGKDTSVPTEGLATSDGSQPLRFSNDSTYLSVVGSYAADTRKNGMELQVISASTGTVVAHVDKEGTQYEGFGIASLGWAEDHSFVYATNTSSTGSFDPFQATTHTIDASTGKTFDFPQGTGEPLTVLNYQKN